ncbi:3-deoxy-manno-octulosonate cytidylyltransferase [Polaribacter litorisediminis]|uniref:3-deoxy-manno-octulosonate cytidylyltransferase n=1 Tax=Polaribacter litorisediminis TaxID=1908341 RepID=UPI001CBE156E|nr:3-deoxy-manno-octulosonate cytidylyltransferase [Polaribacter litorisediminis]UAM96628.1 3-deoxy-manno-octulosonate cytidylyltransferase [Polaribacter litorisediminis]
MDYVIVIPARYASSRLPGKPLIDLNGQSVLERTYRQCQKAVQTEKIIVATDDQRIEAHCKAKGMQVMMTSKNCLTGTDRVAEVAEQIEADYYINVQGDEPLMNPQDIRDTIEATQKYQGDIINGYALITEESQFRSLSIPKLVFRPDGRLLYMSRSPIPGNKCEEFKMAWRQICIYAFTKPALQAFVAENTKTPLEAEEDIEILRFLELGYEVRMIPLSKDSIAIDLPEDVERVLKKLKESE